MSSTQVSDRRAGASLRSVSTITAAASYLLVVLGDTVRVTDSGMGCRSWPLCNGHVGLVGTYHALLEQSHRYLAGILSVLVLATFALAWRARREHRSLWLAAATSVVLLGAQVVLGAVTVFAHNAGWTVALHLAGAWLLVAAIVVTASLAWRPARAGARALATADLVARAAAAVLFAVAVSGMLVLHDGASRACPTWPGCSEPAPLAPLTLQYAHRMFVAAGSIAVLAAAWFSWRRPGSRGADRAAAVLSVLLLVATAVAGALVATRGAGPLAEDVHLALASALWVSVVVMAARPAGQGPPRESDRSAGARAGREVVAQSG